MGWFIPLVSTPKPFVSETLLMSGTMACLIVTMYCWSLNSSDYRDSRYDYPKWFNASFCIEYFRWVNPGIIVPYTFIHSELCMDVGNIFMYIVWLRKSFPQTMRHSNCLYSLRNSNWSDNAGLSYPCSRQVSNLTWLIKSTLS